MKILKVVGIILLMGLIVSLGGMVGGLAGDLITIVGFVAGVMAIIKIIKNKKVPQTN